jgi:hypothetical protein
MYVEGTMAINGSLRVFEIIEKATVTPVTLTGSIPIYLADNNVYYFTAEATGDWTIQFRGDQSGRPVGGTDILNPALLAVGESMTVALVTTQGATPRRPIGVSIDTLDVTPYFYGGEQISANPNGIDVYTYVIIRAAASGPGQFTVLCSQAQYKRL